MTAAAFVHLRTHSAFSLSQSTLRIGTLCDLATNDSQAALAITDSFNMFGALEFSKKVIEKGVQPLSALLSPCVIHTGQVRLCYLPKMKQAILTSHTSYLMHLWQREGGDDASIPTDQLAKRHEGLILLTGGAISGFIGNACAQNQLKLAQERLDSLSAFMKDRIYIELQRHGHVEESVAEPALLKLADETGLPLVATK